MAKSIKVALNIWIEPTALSFSGIFFLRIEIRSYNIVRG